MIYQTCYQCDFQFKETSIQFYRRIKNHSPSICQDCYRISQAELRHKKRLEKQQKSSEDLLYEKAAILAQKHKKISIPYLIKQFKLSTHEARLLEDRLQTVLHQL